LFKDVDGRESPAMTSLELGINGARLGQATSVEPHDADLVGMKQHAGRPAFTLDLGALNASFGNT
jgi:hypothetical protein